MIHGEPMGFRILRSGEHSKFKSLHEKSDHPGRFSVWSGQFPRTAYTVYFNHRHQVVGRSYK
jgi:hypothetical protein